jgi:hypothetical protein
MMSPKFNLSTPMHLRDAWRRVVTRHVIRRRAADMRGSQDGMSTAEYAIGTVAACAFAAVLYKVITSTEVLSLLSGVVTRALHVPF